MRFMAGRCLRCDTVVSPLRRRRRRGRSVKSYTFKCIREGGPGPAVHMDTCEDDEHARRRAKDLFELWPLAVKIDVSQGERHFEIER